MPIENISDTARWVAVYRAMETERPDAIFRDPHARRLAGDRGAEIVDAMPRGREMAWAMIVRTALFDEVILDRVRAGVDLVVNLAAGLDARPWRLALPPTLRWVDVDLRWWLIDLAHPRLLVLMTKMWGKVLSAGNAPFRFAPVEGPDFFRPFGWREAGFHSTFEAARRLRREMRMAWLWRLLARLSPPKRREEIRRFSGAVLLERA